MLKFGELFRQSPNQVVQSDDGPVQMRLIDFSIFKNLNHIPRSDEPIQSLTVEDLNNPTNENSMLKRNQCLVVFISHRWFRSGSKNPRPDTNKNTKYHLIVKSIESLIASVGENVSVFLWIDYFCVDQDNQEQKMQSIRSLPYFISNSDCILTPLSEDFCTSQTSSSIFSCFGGCFPSSDAMSGPLPLMFECVSNARDEFFGRAWCRLEMYIGMYVPLPRGGINYFKMKKIENRETKRPHFITVKEFREGALQIMPPLGYNWLKLLTPLKGAITYNNDWAEIRKLALQFCHQDSGPSFAGTLQDHRKNGHGVQIYRDGSRYEGFWKDDKRHGQGVDVRCNGERYEGNWVEDMKQGKGKLFFTNGDIYDGEWHCGKMHGKGTLYVFLEGTIEGVWKSNYDGKSLVEGTFLYENGDKFEGTWKDGLRDGPGTLTYPDGAKLVGTWENDTICGEGTFYSGDCTHSVKYRRAQRSKPRRRRNIDDPVLSLC